MHIHLVIIFSLICGPASAAEGATTAPSAATAISIPPAATGQPHSCEEYYPALAAKLDTQGTTTLAFHITADGNVTGAQVTQSSGNTDLDEASLTCVSRWQYKPATQNGVAIDIPWKANVVWKNNMSPAVQLAQDCLYYTKNPYRSLSGLGTTILTFWIMPDGSIKNVHVTQSGGDYSFDDAAVTCMNARHYDVSTATLPPSGIAGHAELDWSHASPAVAFITRREIPPKKDCNGKPCSTPSK